MEAPSRVLIVCTHFWPSIGGLETIAEFLGNYLVRTGYQVDVATLYRQDRPFNLYRGINIVSLDASRTFNDTPLWIIQLRQLVTSGQYDACILMADPLNPIIWSLHQADIHSNTKVIIQPIINKDGYAKWCDNKAFRRNLADILKKAHAVVALTRNGVEMQYFKEEGISSILIPNAVDIVAPAMDFRAKFNISKKSFVILHIANLWPVKNHLGILDALRVIPPDWRFVMIGHPSQDQSYVSQVQESTRRNPQVVYIPGLPREGVAAALEAADVVILASYGEVSPVTMLEAMSHKKPWVATPECGAVHDLAGGVIVPLNDFTKVLSLLANSEYLQKLGSVGYEHWQACYHWPNVILAWDELIQTGFTQKTFGMPESVKQKQETLQAHILEKLNESTSPGTKATHKPELPMHRVSIIIPTYNRPDFLIKALESIAAQTYKNCEIVVVNDAGRDVSAIVNSFQGRLAITYLAHTENKGVAASRNTGISTAMGKYIAYLDDDDIYYPSHIETLVNFLENSDYKVAYTDAYRAYQEKEDGVYVTKKREVTYSYDFQYDYILVNNFVPVLCIMHEKDCILETGIFDESLMSLEDMDCWIRMSRKYKFAHIKRITCEFTWREDGTSITSGQRPEFLKAIQIIYDKYREYALNKPHVLKAQEELLSDLKYAVTSRKNTFKYNQTFREKRQTCTIIIPVFNKVEFTRKCIESIIRNSPPNQFEIIIIDNASTDGTKDFLKSFVGNIRVITNEKNLGFAKACNQGANVASDEYLLFLNNDTEPEKGWLEPLFEVLDKDPSVGAVGSKLLFPAGTIQHAGVAIVNSKKSNDPVLPLHIYANEPSHLPDANQLFQYQALTAACLLIRKSAFNETGGFDEGYWNGYEDVDLCFKLQEKGWKLVYQPESVVIHHESKSGPERFSRLSENIQRLHNKWIGKIKPDIIIKEDGATVVTENNKVRRYLLPHTNLAKTFDKRQLKTVSIIMLTWNALDYTRKCIYSIQYHTSYPHEMVFVDNASTDGTVEYLRNLVKEHSNYKLIENKENRGFAAGNNQGVVAASGDYVLLLNNDVLVSDGWLESLVESLEKDEEIGMVGPITNSISGRQMVNSIPYTDDAGFHAFSQKIRKSYNGRLTPRYRIAGFAVLMKKSLYEDVGGLDESFGTGNYEDDDLCLKIRDKGYAVMVDESVFIHHYRSQTFIENKIDYRSSLSVNESKFMKKRPDVDYKSLLELDKSLVDINADLVAQGQKAIESENADEAIKAYTKVLGTNPIDEAALCGIGMAYHIAGKTDSAIDAYKKVIKKYTYFSSRQLPSGGNSYLLDAYHNLAIVYAGSNQIDEAIFMLKKAVELSSSDATLRNNLGVLYYKKKMHSEAAKCFSYALSIDAHYEEAKKNLEKTLAED